MKILYCTDFSDSAIHFFEKAQSFLKEDSEIDIINVIETDYLTHLSLHPHLNKDDFRIFKEKSFEELKTYIKSKNFKVADVFSPEGHPAEEILKQSQNKDYNLLIIGSRAKKGFGKWLGSVSRKVVTKSFIPVFVAKFHNNAENIKEILFAVDGSENSYNAVNKAFDVINLKNSKIEIIYVKQGTLGLPPEIISDKDWLQRILAKQDELAEEIMDYNDNIVEKKGFTVDSGLIQEGDPAEGILNYTDKSVKDLIIMGSHGREGLSQLLLGSVSKRILDNTSCSVLIIPTKKSVKCK